MPSNVQLNENVTALTNSVETLTDRLDNISTNSDIKKLIESVKTLTEKLEAFTVSQNATNNTIQDSITHIRETIITNLTNANNEMSERIDVLDDKIIKLEKQLAISAQRSRENNIEIHGIDDRVTDTLESTVIRVIKLLDIDCSEDGIQGCHRLPFRKGSTLKPTIIKFVKRKKAD